MSNENAFHNQLELLRSEVSTSYYKEILLPIYSLKYLQLQNRLPEEFSLDGLLRSEGNLKEELVETFENIEETFPQLKNVYDIFPDQPMSNRGLFQLLQQVNVMEISTEAWGPFVTQSLSQLYEMEGKNQGGVYSPQSINQLGIEILNPRNGTFYDGTAGVGGTVAAAAAFSVKHGGNIRLYGQEINHKYWALCKLHLLFYDRLDIELAHGDVLKNPAFTEDKNVKKNDYVMMDFPFSAALGNDVNLTKDKYNRFMYGDVPKRNADMAFIMHALSSLDGHGKAVLVVSNGTLFRAGMEQSVRENLIKADVIEAIIALPGGMYAETAIPSNLMILNKDKPSERKGKILFLNAESQVQSGRRHHYLKQENIQEITDIYRSGKEMEQYSIFVPNDKIDEANLMCDKYLIDREIDTSVFGKVLLSKNEIEGTHANTLGNLTKEIYRGMNVSSKSVEEGKGEYRLIKLSDVQDGDILLSELTKVTLKRNSRVDKYLVAQGDVIISNRGTSIKVAVVPETEEEILLSHNFLGIRCGDKIDPYYLKAYLESPVGMYYLLNSQSGMNILTINPKDLRSVPLHIVDISKQADIAKRFKTANQVYRKRLQEAEEERKSSFLTLYGEMGIRKSFRTLN